MHRLKSVFITGYLLTLMAALFWAGRQLWSAPGGLSGWGVVLASGVPLAFFARLYLAPVARTGAHLFALPLAGVIGTLMAVLGDGMGVAAAIAFTNGVLLAVTYSHWYSRFAERTSATLTVGQALPELTLEAIDGQRLTTRDLTLKPALWLFYRGNWCPLCMAQIREVAEAYRHLHARGVEVYLISPQPQAHTRSLAERFDAPMQFLQDRDNQAAERLGILAKGGLPLGMQALGYDSDVPMPTVFITAPGGRVVYSDLTDNYRIRPEPAEFIAALDRAGL